jgi:hypothetical protein
MRESDIYSTVEIDYTNPVFLHKYIYSIQNIFGFVPGREHVSRYCSFLKEKPEKKK